MKILVVDDDFRNIFAMSALLERGHAEVIVAESGADAIAALEQTPDIDIVLMDIMMPVMDGYETIRAIRRSIGSRRCRSSRSPARRRPASASAASMPAPTTTSPSRSTPPSSSLRSGPGCPHPHGLRDRGSPFGPCKPVRASSPGRRP